MFFKRYYNARYYNIWAVQAEISETQIILLYVVLLFIFFNIPVYNQEYSPYETGHKNSIGQLNAHISFDGK